MASTFRIEYNAYIVPKEITTLADGVDTITTLNSQVDKTFTGGGKVIYDNNTNITTTYTSNGANTKTLTEMLGTDYGWTDINFLFVKITTGSTAVDPSVRILSNAVGICDITSNNDFVILPRPVVNGSFTFTFNKANITIELYVSGTVV